MSPLVEPPNSVLLVAGADDVEPPADLGGAVCAATDDCVAVGVLSVDDGPTRVGLSSDPDPAGLDRVGTFAVATTGRLTVRSVLGEQYASLAVRPGVVLVSVWTDDPSEPSQVEVRVAERR